MDFQSAMETFAEAWVAANTQTPLTEAAEAQSLAAVPSSVAAPPPPPTGGGVGTTASGGSGASGIGGQPGASRAPSSPPPSSLAHGSPEDQDRSSSSCEALAPTRPPPPTLAGKTLPVHCVVERVPSPQTESQQPSVEVDSYAIVPSAALFADLVRTALTKLGYSPSEAICAKGVVQIKNWKPLSFDQITELPEATVGDMLSDLVQVATLRIRLYSRPKPNVVNDVKEKLLQVLLAQSHSLLLSSGCPIDQTTLAALSKGKPEWEISEDTRRKFDQWYLHQVFQHCRQVALLQHQFQQQHLQQQKHVSPAQPPTRLLQLTLSQPPLQTQPPPPSSATSMVAQPVALMNTPPPAATPGVQPTITQQPHPACLQQSLGGSGGGGGGGCSSRTRIRTSFDPELELPKLHRWFAENQHPSRLTIQQYVRELNALDSRRGRKPLDVNNVVYWFKNARAAHKRAELKLFSGVSPGGGGGGSSLAAAPGDGAPPAMLSNGFLPPLRSPAWDCGLDLTQDSDDGFRQHRSNGFASSAAALAAGEAADIMHVDFYEDEYDSPPPSPEATLDLSMRGRNGDLIKEEPRDSQGSSDMEEDEGGGGGDDSAQDSEDEEARCPISAAAAAATTTATATTTTTTAATTSGAVARVESPGTLRDERRKRNRTFIDPVTEVPRLERWFALNTHPSHAQIVRHTDELNSAPYRNRFPRLEPRNVQFWFKNRRAKCKRLATGGVQSQRPSSASPGPRPAVAGSGGEVAASASAASSPLDAGVRSSSSPPPPVQASVQ